MIYGIYVKNKPNSKWHRVLMTMSPEAANYEVTERKKIANQGGNEEAQVAIQTFDSAFWIPEYMDEIKERQALLN
jgi:hypothetical protein